MAEHKKSRASLHAEMNNQKTTKVDGAAWTGLVEGIKKRFGMSRISDAATASDPLARQSTRAVVHRPSESSPGARGENVSQVISQSSQVQANYLLSIDSTLKDMRRQLAAQQIALDRSKQKNEAMQLRLDAKYGVNSKAKPIRKKKNASEGVSGDLEDTIKETFTIGNFLKYGAASAATGYDIYQGSNKSQEWGVDPVVGGLAGGIGGSSGKGSMINAINKAYGLGTVGHMIYGPIGSLIGTILGGIGGWLGGEELAHFISDLIERIPSTLMAKYKAEFIDQNNRLLDKITDKTKDSWTGLVRMGEDLVHGIQNLIKILLAGVEDKIGDMFKLLGKAPGMEFLDSAGDTLKKRAAETQASVGADDLKIREAREAEDNVTKRGRGERDERRTEVENTHTLAALYAQSDKNNPKSPKFMGPPVPPEIQAQLEKKDQEQNPNSPKQVPGTPDSSGRPSNIGSDLTVGQVSGADIKSAVDDANQRTSKRFSDTLPKVDARDIATIVDKESSGILHPKTGDGQGITQMRAAAVSDVNDAFGTNFTLDQIRNDHKAALSASALFYRLKLRQTDGNSQEASRLYNGKGPQAVAYSEDFAARKAAIPNAPPALAVVPPEPKQTGEKMTATAKENDAIREAIALGASGGMGSIIAPSITNVDHSTTNYPAIVRTRSDEPTMTDVLFSVNNN